MKMKKLIIFCLTVFMLINLAGCEKTAITKKEQLNSSEELKEQQKEDPIIGEITDSEELEKLWQEYIFDSITTVSNTQEFNSAAEIDPVNVAKFCWFKYISEHGAESLALAEKDSSLRLFPLDTVLEYANRYFNLSSLDVSKVSSSYYDPERRSFIFSYVSKRKRSSYNENNAWGLYLDSVTRNIDGTVTVVLVRYNSYEKQLVELTKTFTLKSRDDGSMYFVHGKGQYVNNHLVTLIGDYKHFDKILGYEGTMEELSMVGEADGRLILANIPYRKGKNASLMLVNPDTMEVEKLLELNDNCAEFGVKFAGEKVVIRFKNKIVTIDKNLEILKEIPLPEIISEKIAREVNYQNGWTDVYFGGYDISLDQTKYVYADETGLKLYDTVDNSEKLLSKTVDIKDSELLKYSYHRFPRFIANDKKVITTMTGYESTMGYTMCDLEKGSSQALNISWEGTTANIRYDTGLLEVNTYLYDKIKQVSKMKTLYLDFNTGEVSEIELENTGETGNLRDQEYCYIGQNYGAFITNTWDTNDNANNMSYINLLNLDTLKVEPNIISAKAARTYILGVLADGRVLFWYNYNPSECGIGITKQ